MEHAKKLVLVPRETIERLERIANEKMNSVQTPGNELSRTDAEMSRVLQSKVGDDSEKWKLFSQQLQRFLNMKQAEHSPHEDEGGEREHPRETKKLQRQISLASRDRLLELIPHKYKTKVDQLLRMLYTSDKISWDDAGTVTINGRLLEGSNVVDLLNDAARSRKEFSAKYRADFAKLLREINTPSELVGNKDLWKLGTPEKGTTATSDSATSSPYSDAQESHSSGRKRRKKQWARL